MTTDNRTNEKIETRKCSNQACPLRRAHSGPCAPSAWKPGASSEAQVEAAAKAIADSLFSRWTLTSRVRASKDRGSLIHVAARAALVAAAGAAPQAPKDIHEPNHDRVYCVRCGGNWPCQPDAATAASVAPLAESVPTSKYISPHLPSMIRNLWKSDPSENSVRTALKLAGDLIQELIDLRAATVQPSSTVDEAALSDVLSEAVKTYAAYYKPEPFETYAARAVAEYLTG